MITGNAVVCGLIANPVGHSLSPFMHRLFAEAAGADYAYVPCLVQEDGLEDAVRGAYALGFRGLNVTIPYKQKVIRCLSRLDGSALHMGAVNTLLRTDDGFVGYNTDVEGLSRSMKRHGMRIKGSDCLLIGAGGAARAAACLFAEEGAASVTVLNRSRERAEEIAGMLRGLFRERQGDGGHSEPEIRVLSLNEWERLEGDSYLAVQTTSVGMHPNGDAAPIEDKRFYRKIRSAVDVIYTPVRTRFARMVEEAGGTCVNGLDMLLYQGAAAFELWNPGSIISDEALLAVRDRMEERLNG